MAISPGDTDREELRAWVGTLGRAGVDALQIREKQLGDLELYRRVREAVEAVPARTRILVNGRADIAWAAGAAGVHLPSAGVPVAPLRRRFGAELLIGRSTHSIQEIDNARREGADYVTFGPVYPTPSKQGDGAPAGLEGLREAVAAGLPVLALGGVFPDHFSLLATHGAWGVAGIRMFQDPDGIDAMLLQVRACFDRPETPPGGRLS